MTFISSSLSLSLINGGEKTSLSVLYSLCLVLLTQSSMFSMQMTGGSSLKPWRCVCFVIQPSLGVSRLAGERGGGGEIPAE